MMLLDDVKRMTTACVLMVVAVVYACGVIVPVFFFLYLGYATQPCFPGKSVLRYTSHAADGKVLSVMSYIVPVVLILSCLVALAVAYHCRRFEEETIRIGGSAVTSRKNPRPAHSPAEILNNGSVAFPPRYEEGSKANWPSHATCPSLQSQNGPRLDDNTGIACPDSDDSASLKYPPFPYDTALAAVLAVVLEFVFCVRQFAYWQQVESEVMSTRGWAQLWAADRFLSLLALALLPCCWTMDPYLRDAFRCHRNAPDAQEKEEVKDWANPGDLSEERGGAGKPASYRGTEVGVYQNTLGDERRGSDHDAFADDWERDRENAVTREREPLEQKALSEWRRENVAARLLDWGEENGIVWQQKRLREKAYSNGRGHHGREHWAGGQGEAEARNTSGRDWARDGDDVLTQLTERQGHGMASEQRERTDQYVASGFSESPGRNSSGDPRGGSEQSNIKERDSLLKPRGWAEGDRGIELGCGRHRTGRRSGEIMAAAERGGEGGAFPVHRGGETTPNIPFGARELMRDQVTASKPGGPPDLTNKGRRHEGDTLGDRRVWGGQEVFGEQRGKEGHTFCEQRGREGRTFGEQRREGHTFGEPMGWEGHEQMEREGHKFGEPRGREGHTFGGQRKDGHTFGEQMGRKGREQMRRGGHIFGEQRGREGHTCSERRGSEGHSFSEQRGGEGHNFSEQRREGQAFSEPRGREGHTVGEQRKEGHTFGKRTGLEGHEQMGAGGRILGEHRGQEGHTFGEQMGRGGRVYFVPRRGAEQTTLSAPQDGKVCRGLGAERTRTWRGGRASRDFHRAPNGGTERDLSQQKSSVGQEGGDGQEGRFVQEGTDGREGRTRKGTFIGPRRRMGNNFLPGQQTRNKQYTTSGQMGGVGQNLSGEQKVGQNLLRERKTGRNLFGEQKTDRSMSGRQTRGRREPEENGSGRQGRGAEETAVTGARAGGHSLLGGMGADNNVVGGRGAGNSALGGRGACISVLDRKGAGNGGVSGRGAGNSALDGKGAGNSVVGGRGAGNSVLCVRGAGNSVLDGKGAGNIAVRGRGAGYGVVGKGGELSFSFGVDGRRHTVPEQNVDSEC